MAKRTIRKPVPALMVIMINPSFAALQERGLNTACLIAFRLLDPAGAGHPVGLDFFFDEAVALFIDRNGQAIV